MSGIPLPVADLEKHIKMLYADGQIGLSREYESLATLLTVTAPGQPNIHGSSTFSPSLKEALRPENRPKNRYVNVSTIYSHSICPGYCLMGWRPCRIPTDEHGSCTLSLSMKRVLRVQHPSPQTFYHLIFDWRTYQ